MSKFMSVFGYLVHVNTLPRKRFKTDRNYLKHNDVEVTFTTSPVILTEFGNEGDAEMVVASYMSPGAIFIQNCEGDFKN